MLQMPKKRICPSRYFSNCANILRHPAGDTKGNKPSMTNTKAMANQKVSLFTHYFLVLVAGAMPPRNTLKNSEDEGSRTITSLLLAKLAL